MAEGRKSPLDGAALANEEEVIRERALENPASVSPAITLSSSNSSAKARINGRDVSAEEIVKRQLKVLNSIPTSSYARLSEAERLIIDLPLIMIQLPDNDTYWVYAAYMALHWLEGTGDEIEIPIEFVERYERTKSVKATALKTLQEAQFGGYDDYHRKLGEDGTATDSPIFLYDLTLPSVEESYKRARAFMENVYDPKPFGDFIFHKRRFNSDDTKIDESGGNLDRANFVKSFSIGDIAGNLDDLGGSLNRFSMRFYVTGEVSFGGDFGPGFDWCKLVTNKCAYFYFDDYSFRDEQNLGYWKYDLMNPTTPVRFPAVVEAIGDWTNLNNSIYRGLKTKKLGIGKDFFVRTPLTTFDYKKTIEFNFLET